MEKQQPFVIERTYNAPVSRVWKAISDKDQMKQWYFDIPEFKPVVGTEFEFSGGPDDRVYRHLCVVKEVIEERKLSYSWRYDGYEGDSLVTFELFPAGDKTTVRLTHEGLETFPASNPDLAKENFAAGWNDIIGSLLTKFVEMENLNRDITLAADAETVWNVLTDAGKVKQWASAFGDGVYAHTDWQKGSTVEWMHGDGTPGVKGIVDENEPAKVLRVRFFERVEDVNPADLGDYIEEYRLSEKDGKTELEITTGPLSLKDIEMLSPMWDKALERIQELAEK
jgi:uncharacterized protein YndB with AHSA1/START domain